VLRRALAGLAAEPGIAGAHLLQTDTPAAPQTTEQRLRGGQDAAADWIVLVTGFDAAALRSCLAESLGGERLEAAGEVEQGVFHLRHSATAADLRALA
jgi:hypothetical protein